MLCPCDNDANKNDPWRFLQLVPPPPFFMDHNSNQYCFQHHLAADHLGFYAAWESRHQSDNFPTYTSSKQRHTSNQSKLGPEILALPMLLLTCTALEIVSHDCYLPIHPFSTQPTPPPLSIPPHPLCCLKWVLVCRFKVKKYFSWTSLIRIDKFCHVSISLYRMSLGG